MKEERPMRVNSNIVRLRWLPAQEFDVEYPWAGLSLTIKYFNVEFRGLRYGRKHTIFISRIVLSVTESTKRPKLVPATFFYWNLDLIYVL